MNVLETRNVVMFHFMGCKPAKLVIRPSKKNCDFRIVLGQVILNLTKFILKRIVILIILNKY